MAVDKSVVNATTGKSVTHNLLDSVFYPEFELEKAPGHVDETSSLVFNQKKSNLDQITIQNYAGPGYLSKFANDTDDYPEASVEVGDAKVLPMSKFGELLKISEDFQADDKFDVTMESIRDLARVARLTRQMNAFGAYRNAFTTETTGDGQALISATHQNLNGDTISNLVDFESGTDNMQAAIEEMLRKLQSQKAQNGTLGGYRGATLLVDPELFAEATVATDSELRSGTQNNDLNYLSKVFPGLKVVTNEFISAAEGGQAGAMFLIAGRSPVTRWVRKDISTVYSPLEVYTNADFHSYRVRFREVIGAPSYEGIVGARNVV